MEKLIIADITTLTYNSNIYGHFLKVSLNYMDILSNEYEVQIAGGKTYKKFIEENKFIMLPYIIENGQKSIINKFKEFINCKAVLKSNCKNYIFQCYSFLPMMIGIFLFYKKDMCIYTIQYEPFKKNIINNIVMKLNKKKIKGIICPNKEVGKSYNNEFVVVNDYIIKQKNKIINSDKLEIDFLVVGTMSEGKDIEMVVNAFKNSKFNVTVVGNFQDKDRYKRICNIATENIKILDKYLTDQEYEEYIYKCKYIILPYKKSYDMKSSGVVLDALFNYKPVIVPSLKSFEFVSEKKLGYVYKNDIKEITNEINGINYNVVIKNIEKYISSNNDVEKLIKFLRKKF